MTAVQMPLSGLERGPIPTRSFDERCPCDVCHWGRVAAGRHARARAWPRGDQQARLVLEHIIRA